MTQFLGVFPCRNVSFTSFSCGWKHHLLICPSDFSTRLQGEQEVQWFVPSCNHGEWHSGRDLLLSALGISQSVLWGHSQQVGKVKSMVLQCLVLVLPGWNFGRWRNLQHKKPKKNGQAWWKGIKETRIKIRKISGFVCQVGLSQWLEPARMLAAVARERVVGSGSRFWWEKTHGALTLVAVDA